MNTPTATNAASFPKNVDFVVGTQYGDEGKGMVAKLMADRAEQDGNPYTWSARVGAQNAEHRFVHDACDLCARILPSACAFRDDTHGTNHAPILALLGAGHCFRPEHLLYEATHLGVPLDRIFVDDLAMWLKDEHATSNRERGDARGTTGWGIGAAIAEKVARSPHTQLMRDSDLAENGVWVGALGPNMNTLFKDRGLFEGSQGFMLSLNHGRYPWSTAKDVTITNMCSELGLAYKRINKVIGVARLVFMRVSGPSGPTGGAEISYSDVEKRTGLRFPHHKRLQGDSMLWSSTVGASKGATDEERLFDLSMEELAYSHSVNGYDELAVTFCDMHRAGNYRVRSWNQLHVDTKKAIDHIEDTLNVPVVLVRTGQGEHDNIWRHHYAQDSND